MRNDKGITLVTVIIMIIIIAIITSVSVINGTRTVNDAKESAKEQNLAAVKAAVSEISMKKGMAGVLTPANAMIYGTPVKNVLEVVDGSLDNWYVLEQEDLKEMGIDYVENTYVVNFEDNEVYSLADFQISKYADNIFQSDDIKVTFDANGGTVGIANKKMKYGEAYGDLPVPIRAGYTFKGWNGKNMLNFYDRTKGNLTGGGNKEKRNFDFDKYYVGLTMNNYFNPSHVLMAQLTDNWHLFIKEGADGYGVGFPIQVKANTKYCWSREDENNVGIGFYDNEGSLLSYKNSHNMNYSFTTPEDCYVITIILRPVTNVEVIYSDIQLEEGSIATEYEPYYITSSTTVVQPNNHTLTAVWEKNL